MRGTRNVRRRRYCMRFIECRRMQHRPYTHSRTRSDSSVLLLPRQPLDLQAKSSHIRAVSARRICNSRRQGGLIVIPAQYGSSQRGMSDGTKDHESKVARLEGLDFSTISGGGGFQLRPRNSCAGKKMEPPAEV